MNICTSNSPPSQSPKTLCASHENVNIKIMRLLKLPIKEKSIQFSIEIFENKDVAIIAMQYSKTQFELEKLYSVGMSGLEKAKMNYGYGTDKFIRFSMWWVRQSILKYSKENFTT